MFKARYKNEEKKTEYARNKRGRAIRFKSRQVARKWMRNNLPWIRNYEVLPVGPRRQRKGKP